MKRIVFLLGFIVVSMVAKAQFTVYEPVEPVVPNTRVTVPNTYPFTIYTPVDVPAPSRRYKAETQITGTTYNALVIYESSTGHSNTYRLAVVVNNGAVKKICFNDGGSVHVGTNHSGYTYYGGELEYIDEIEAFATVVKIVYESGRWQEFTIVLDD